MKNKLMLTDKEFMALDEKDFREISEFNLPLNISKYNCENKEHIIEIVKIIIEHLPFYIYTSMGGHFFKEKQKYELWSLNENEENWGDWCNNLNFHYSKNYNDEFTEVVISMNALLKIYNGSTEEYYQDIVYPTTIYLIYDGRPEKLIHEFWIIFSLDAPPVLFRSRTYGEYNTRLVIESFKNLQEALCMSDADVQIIPPLEESILSVLK